MKIVRSEEQETLREAVRALVDRHATPARIAQVADAGEGFDADLWAKLTHELGVTGLLIPSQYGGAGASWREAAAVLQELGRTLAPVPFLSSSILAVTALLEMDDEASASLLRRISSGGVVSVGMSGPSGVVSPEAVPLTATRDAGEWRVQGELSHVPDGPAAEAVLVLARILEGDLRWFAIERGEANCTARRMEVLDGTRPQAVIAFTGARATALESQKGAWDVAERIIDAASTGQACEQQAASKHLLALTIEYARERFQFGRPIGSFQAIQHRCADLALLVDESTSAMEFCLWAATDNPEEWRLASSLAAVVCGEAFEAVAREAIQIHGGIGFSWEHVAHRYFRRALASKSAFGAPDEHRERLLRAVSV